ncbi:RNA-directed DNA polymerase, eukaryota, reverse transcriptase zinc-binding domain protein [Tanacetum coccineum]
MVNWIMVCLKSASFSVCINVESHGFFKAKRGLRQGDPVSPYLFIIVIEVFTLMLRIQVKNKKKFKYHWGCKELKILNLYFVDDLVMFCHGDMISASVMRRALDEFCLSSGLRPSMAKSTVYFGNVPNDAKEEIKIVMPFCEGTLPIKYLGIPLNSSMIVKNDCSVLFEKIKKRVEDWRNKALSYARRLQLIASKSEGGLGIKSMKVWNEALMAKYLCNVIIDKDSIWVRWVKTTWLKNDSIWVVEHKKLNSWGWNQILALRDGMTEALSEVEDKAIWINKKSKEKDFNVKEVWKGIKSDAAKERNNRLFGGHSRSEDVVFKLIVETVRYKIMGFKLKTTNDVINAADIWNFPVDKMIWIDGLFGLLKSHLSKALDHERLGGAAMTSFLCFLDMRYFKWNGWSCLEKFVYQFQEAACNMKVNDCTRSNDVDLHVNWITCSSLGYLAYGDVLSCADWSQHGLVIQIGSIRRIERCGIWHIEDFLEHEYPVYSLMDTAYWSSEE